MARSDLFFHLLSSKSQDQSLDAMSATVIFQVRILLRLRSKRE
jgi:hypothetical protein